MKYIFKEMPDMQKTGERKVYPKVVHGAPIPFETIVNLMSEVTQLSRTNIKGVFIELADIINMYLAQGQAVKIDNLGTFNAVLGIKKGVKAQTVKEEGERYDVKDVYVKGIHFLPDADWLRRLRHQSKLQRIKGTSTLAEVKTTMEERRLIALNYLEENPFIRVGTYAYLTGVNRTKANQELNQFCDDPESGITSSGIHNQKVYVKR